MEGHIIIGSIAKYDAASGKYYVKYANMSASTAQGYPAQLLSPVPVSDGGGTKAVPANPIDTPCMIFKVGTQHYIVGFLTPKGITANDSPVPTRALEPGEQYQKHNTGTLFGVNKYGSFTIWVHQFMNFVLNPIKQQFTAMFKNMAINFYAGSIEYRFNSKKNTSTLSAFISKEFDKSSVDPTQMPRDVAMAKVGFVETDEHMVEAGIFQDFLPTYEPEYSAVAQVGKQEDGTFLNLKSSHGITGAAVEHVIKANIDGTLEATIKNKVDMNAVKLTISTATPKVELDVADGKALVTIDNLGNVTVKTADGANIKLGGQDKEQALVTESWVTQVFKNHIHPTSSPGAPTLIPTPDLTLPTSSDNPKGHFTYTTKAE
jgi:hypothetical protein